MLNYLPTQTRNLKLLLTKFEENLYKFLGISKEKYCLFIHPQVTWYNYFITVTELYRSLTFSNLKYKSCVDIHHNMYVFSVIESLIKPATNQYFQNKWKSKSAHIYILTC